MTVNYSSPVRNRVWPPRLSLLTGGVVSVATNGSSTPNGPLPARRRSWRICAVTPIGSPSPTAVWRLWTCQNGTVTFRYKDYAHQSQIRSMTLPLAEFLRRFCLHILPLRFVKIRHYGLLSNRDRSARIAQARALLAQVPSPSEEARGSRPDHQACGSASAGLSSLRPARSGPDRASSTALKLRPFGIAHEFLLQVLWICRRVAGRLPLGAAGFTSLLSLTTMVGASSGPDRLPDLTPSAADFLFQAPRAVISPLAASFLHPLGPFSVNQTRMLSPVSIYSTSQPQRFSSMLSGVSAMVRGTSKSFSTISGRTIADTPLSIMQSCA